MRQEFLIFFNRIITILFGSFLSLVSKAYANEQDDRSDAFTRDLVNGLNEGEVAWSSKSKSFRVSAQLVSRFLYHGHISTPELRYLIRGTGVDTFPQTNIESDGEIMFSSIKDRLNPKLMEYLMGESIGALKEMAFDRGH